MHSASPNFEPRFDYVALSAELLRAIRGKRSQAVFARRLGYQSNVAHNWEHRRSAPTAARTFWIAHSLGLDVPGALVKFFRLPPAWLEASDLRTPRGLAVLMRDLKGQTQTTEVAAALGKSRFTVSRWLSAKTEPKLPEFLQFVECTTLRLLDFLAAFIDPASLPSAKTEWALLQQARSLAYREPWSLGVLRVLEMPAYRRAPHSRKWIAKQLGCTPKESERCIHLLEESKQIQWDGSHYSESSVRALDIGSDRAKAQELRAWWAARGVERAEAGAPGMVYNLFGVSNVDLERIRLLQKNYLNEVRHIVASSEPVECVALAVDMVIDLKSREE